VISQAWYAPRCTTLTAFSRYCGGAILRGGGSGVLEPELRAIVAPVLHRARSCAGISRPNLGSGGFQPLIIIFSPLEACLGTKSPPINLHCPYQCNLVQW
jgi:hypothetical protein